MKSKATCTLLNIIAIAGITMAPCYAAVGSPEASVFSAMTGGQAPPPAAGGAGFAVRVASNLDQAAADTLKQNLVDEGFTAALARAAGTGYEVVIPGIGNRAQADGIVGELKNSGYTTNVEVISESQGTAGTAGAPAGETVYRVKVAEFDSEQQAVEASKVLVDEGFVNVDISQENGKHVLLLGTFQREGDAQALLGDVNRAGFAMASVATKERLRADGAATADVSALPAGEQGRAREILEMAQKVERGEASAEEVKRLREMVQQMTSTQRQVLNQQESSRAESQNKNQRIFQMYRDFDKAITARDYTRAEQILNQVRQIDPDDIFLPQRVAALEERRSGGAGAAQGPGSGRPDPAEIQKLINEGRAAETAGNPSLAKDKFTQVLALDPANVEAKTKVAQLDGASGADESGAGAASGLMENKMVLYGIGGAVVLIILLLLWMKSRGSKAVKEPTPAGGTSFGATDYSNMPGGSTDFSGSTTPTSSAGLGAATAGGLAGAGMAGAAGYHSIGSDDEEESATPPPPAPVAPVEPESDTVSISDFEEEPAGAPATAAPATEDISLNFDNEELPASASATPAASSSAMEADLEALLKGTFGGEETAPVAAAATGAVAASSGNAAPRVLYSQDFENESAGDSPAEWRGEYDYASLTVDDLGEGDHNRCLKYSKPEGAGSATYHLSFPQASGKIIAEFDIRCEEKNKFLLGVYLEHEEDFKQSIHTIIHQLDPSAPASLRIQGEAVPYTMGEWSRIRYEVDLANARLDAFMNGEHVVKGAELAVAPEYVNTFSIRDNLATTGTLYIDNIQISEA